MADKKHDDPNDMPAEFLPATIIPGTAAPLPMQRVASSYVTAVAVQQPRSLSVVRSKVLEEATFAKDSFFYGWKVKNSDGSSTQIIGASIGLAMAMARIYGNCAIETDVTETPTHYLFKSVFIDLETGFTLPRLFRQRKNQKISSKMDIDRSEDIAFQIGQSKSQRNAIAKAMPEWLIDEAIATAKKAQVSGLTGDNLVKSRSSAYDFFKKYGVELKTIEDFIERKIDNWTADDIVDLRAMASAVTEGRIPVSELFKVAEEGDSGDKAGGLKEMAARAKNGQTEKPPAANGSGPGNAAPEKAKEEPPKAAAPVNPPGGQVSQEPAKASGRKKECPDLFGKMIPEEDCMGCKSLVGCPEWEAPSSQKKEAEKKRQTNLL